MTREFHDLAEAALNHESGGQTCWGNLGLWHGAQTYPEACTALADVLGQALRLGPGSRIVEAGFGCGDSLLHWRRRYGVQAIAGLNLSESQTASARQRLLAAGEPDIAQAITRADVRQLPAWARQQGSGGLSAPDTVLALDCAYHFSDRDQFLLDAAAVLPAGGRLGLTDLLLSRSDLGARERLPLRAFAHLARIPWDNLLTEAPYRARWRAAGFEIEHFEDLTPAVFPGFGLWLRRYRAGLSPEQRRAVNWTKYTATAQVLRWAWKHRVLRYVLCTARKLP